MEKSDEHAAIFLDTGRTLQGYSLEKVYNKVAGLGKSNTVGSVQSENRGITGDVT